MANKHDRRQHPRAKLKLPIVMAATDLLLDGEIQDLSLGGAFIRCREMPCPRDNFRMVITAAGRLIPVTAEVVWTGTQKFNKKNIIGGMGVRFRQIINGDRRFLRNVIAKHYKSKFVRKAIRK